jgi:hypothetical protein
MPSGASGSPLGRDLLFEMIVGRMVREGRAQQRRIAHERASRLERRVQPLVRIHRHRVRLGERTELVRCFRRGRREGAVRAVHMKPDAPLTADRGDRRERIDGAGADRPGRPDDHDRNVAGGHVGVNLQTKGRHVHPQIGAGRDPPDRRGAEAREIRGLVQVCVSACRRRRWPEASLTPCSRTFQPASGARARKQTKFAMLPPDEEAAAVRRKLDRLGNPPDGLRPISVAAGDRIHAPTFGFTAAASRSPRMPIGAGGAAYPKKRGAR